VATAIIREDAAGRGEAVAKEIAAGRIAPFDVAMSRATLAPDKWLALGTRLVRVGGRVFVLAAADALPALREGKASSPREEQPDAAKDSADAAVLSRL